MEEESKALVHVFLVMDSISSKFNEFQKASHETFPVPIILVLVEA